MTRTTSVTKLLVLAMLLIGGVLFVGCTPTTTQPNDDTIADDMDDAMDDVEEAMDDAIDEAEEAMDNIEDAAEDMADEAEDMVDGDDDMDDADDMDEAGEEDDMDEEAMDDAQGEEVVIDVTGVNFAYSQTIIEVNKGDTVTINFESTEGFHDWVVDEFGAATEKVNPGTPTSVTFVADQAGQFEYYCSVGQHRANGMVGTLIVNE